MRWRTHLSAAPSQVVREPFSVEGGTLTQTMKLVRRAVHEQYAADVDALLHRLR
jgi:long-subunit acyl-CoA synthetase (AMP-forming)